MPQVVVPTPQTTPPLRRRKAPEVAASPSPLRSRLLNYVLAFVTVVLVVDALVGDKGLVDTLRARRQHAALAAALAQKRQENARLRDDIRRLQGRSRRDRVAGPRRARADARR